jgi:hypothetical protein
MLDEAGNPDLSKDDLILNVLQHVRPTPDARRYRHDTGRTLVYMKSK